MRTPVSFLVLLIVALATVLVQADKLQAKASNSAFHALATALPADGTVISGESLEVTADVAQAGLTTDNFKGLSFAYLPDGVVNVPVGNSWMMSGQKLRQIVLFGRPSVPIKGKLKLVVSLGDDVLVRTYTAR